MTPESTMRRRGEDISARSVAAQHLAAAFVKVRDELSPNGWVLFQEPAYNDAEHFLVKFSMRQGARPAISCAFQVGPGRAVQFETGDIGTVMRHLDDIAADSFYNLLHGWTMRVRADD